MIKIFALSVEHHPYETQKLTASVTYEALLNSAAQTLKPSDKIRLAIIELIIAMTGEKRNYGLSALSTRHILKFEEGKRMGFWVAEGIDDEGQPKESFLRDLTEKEEEIMAPIVKQYQAFLRKENTPLIASDSPDDEKIN